MLSAARREPIRGYLIGLCVVFGVACGGASVRPDEEGLTGDRDAAAPNNADDADAGSATSGAGGGRDAQTQELDASSGSFDAGKRDASAGGRDASGSDAASSGSDAASGGSDGGRTPPGDAGVEISDGGPGIRWMGRVEKTAQGARFTWSGTGFVARFRGTALSARIKITGQDPDYFQLIVDGKSSVLTVQSGERDYALAQNLASGEHLVTLWRRTETLAGTIEVVNVTVQGELLAPPVPNKRLEVIGDSITAGFGVDCKQDDGFSYSNENHYGTYAGLAARALGADLFTLAQTSIGMWRDDDAQTQNQMPVLYLRTLGNSASSRWNFADWNPGAVVINLGTNDFAFGDPGQDYLNNYVKFVDDMRGRYPAARIYLALSPMLFDELRDTQRRYLEQVKSGRGSKGDTNVAILDLPVPTDNQWGCGHPNAASHAAIAVVLQQALKADLGW
jgi:lysophospholipase L1-like esterase